MPPWRDTQAYQIACDVMDAPVKEVRKAYLYMLDLIEYLPLVILGTPTRFTRLERDLQLEYLYRLLNHPIYSLRILVRIFSIFCYMGYYHDERIKREIGFDQL